MNEPVRAATQQNDRWSIWPETFQALTETYFNRETFGRPGELPANGNYMLAGLKKAADYIRSEHGHRGWIQNTIDLTFAHEVRFLWNRSRRFNRPAAALSTCLFNLAMERPERFEERHTRSMTKRFKSAEKNTR